MFNLNLKFENNTIVVDPEHFPEAEKIVEVKGKYVREIKCLYSHYSEMVNCERLLNYVINNKPNEANFEIIKSIFEYCIMKYYLVFTNSGARKSLSYKKIFKGVEGAIDVFLYFKALRNKYIVHDEGGYNQIMCGLVLNKLTSDQIVEDIICTRVESGIIDNDHIQQLANLVVHTKKYLYNKFEKTKWVILDSYREKSREELEAYPQLTFKVPVAADLTREKSW